MMSAQHITSFTRSLHFCAQHSPALCRAFVCGVLLSLAACGGGGGGDTGTLASAGTPMVPTTPSTTYSTVAMAGEQVTYAVDMSNLTYTYTITDSMYGLTGNRGSGNLTRNSDGSYTPSGIPKARIAILRNGLMFGAIRESMNGVLQTIPVLGGATHVKTLADGAATYNFVQRSCLSGLCTSAYGTFKIDAAGTWSLCSSGNIETGCAGTLNSGTLNSLGGGKWQVLHAGISVGTAIIFSSDGQNLVTLDLVDTRANGFGVGILVGVSQQSMSSARENGTWSAATTRGDWETFTASEGQIDYTIVNGAPVSDRRSSFSENTPWIGIARTPSGGHGFLAGNGVYVYENAEGYAEIGIKLD